MVEQTCVAALSYKTSIACRAESIKKAQVVCTDGAGRMHDTCSTSLCSRLVVIDIMSQLANTCLPKSAVMAKFRFYIASCWLAISSF